MTDSHPADLSLFLDILRTLEEIQASYRIIGAFAGTLYGVSRVTYDIDMVVSLSESDMQHLVAAYPPPRYYADIIQMRNCFRDGGSLFHVWSLARGGSLMSYRLS